MIGHTPGPWAVERVKSEGKLVYARIGPLGRGSIAYSGVYGPSKKKSDVLTEDEAEANARLIAAAPELLAEIEREYEEFGDIRNQWPGRHSSHGQAKLVRLRDLIAKATGRDPEGVQDDYTNRAAAKATGATP